MTPALLSHDLFKNNAAFDVNCFVRTQFLTAEAPDAVLFMDKRFLVFQCNGLCRAAAGALSTADANALIDNRTGLQKRRDHLDQSWQLLGFWLRKIRYSQLLDRRADDIQIFCRLRA